MIIVDVEQRSFEWLEARQGIPTASQLPRLLTEKTRKYSVVGARKYRNEKLAEWFLDASLDGGNTLWMDRGTMLETEARQYYELLRDVELDEVGFCLRDDRRFGASPDALVRDAGGEIVGGLEVKCPSAAEHIAYLLGEHPTKHWAQCQALMYVCSVEWWDLLIYSPSMPRKVERIYRDMRSTSGSWISRSSGS